MAKKKKPKGKAAKSSAAKPTGARKNGSGNRAPKKKALRELVHLWIEDLMDRPVSELFDPAELASTLASGLRGMGKDPNSEAWLAEQLTTSIEEIRHAKLRGKLRSKLPKRASRALRGLAAQPFLIDEDLGVAILDHHAVHALVREVLTQSLLGFAKHATELLPGGRRITGLVGKARRVASVAASVAGVGLDQRVNEFVEDALSPSIDLAAARIADEEFSEDVANWRGHIMEVLLEQNVADLVGTLDQIDPEALAAELAALLSGIAEWDRLESTVQAAMEAALQRMGKKTVRDFLEGTALEDEWRGALEKQLADMVWPFLQTDAFASWLSRR